MTAAYRRIPFPEFAEYKSIQPATIGVPRDAGDFAGHRRKGEQQMVPVFTSSLQVLELQRRLQRARADERNDRDNNRRHN
ncbi:MAG TPA: hypothetical protein VFU81_15630 [Thermomicrobiales bacterium]|nr:hypothetical protein [Thermomicrobiales bacterium]